MIREQNGVAYAVLAVDAGGRLDIVGENTWQADDSGHTAVNRECLLQALDAAGHSQLVLELDGPITPLAVRVPDSESGLSILMPVRPVTPRPTSPTSRLLVGHRADHPLIG